MAATRDSATGKFVRKHQFWTPARWNDGYIDNRGRFRVYRPDYPNAYPEGYALRAHIVWWLATGEICKGRQTRHELHHRDGNRLNDEIENLTRIHRSDHQIAHKCSAVLRRCRHCGNHFSIPRWRLKHRKEHRGKFCSPKCYYAAGGRWN